MNALQLALEPPRREALLQELSVHTGGLGSVARRSVIVGYTNMLAVGRKWRCHAATGRGDRRRRGWARHCTCSWRRRGRRRRRALECLCELRAQLGTVLLLCEQLLRKALNRPRRVHATSPAATGTSTRPAGRTRRMSDGSSGDGMGPMRRVDRWRCNLLKGMSAHRRARGRQPPLGRTYTVGCTIGSGCTIGCGCTSGRRAEWRSPEHGGGSLELGGKELHSLD